MRNRRLIEIAQPLDIRIPSEHQRIGRKMLGEMAASVGLGDTA